MAWVKVRLTVSGDRIMSIRRGSPSDSAVRLFGRTVLTMIAAILIGCAQKSTPTSATVISGNPAPSSPGDSWDSIKQLPDWSGVWAISTESANQAFSDTHGDDKGRVPLRPKYLAMRNAIRTAKSAPGNLPKCLPAGVPGVLQHPMMIEFLFTPGRVTMLFEDGEVRRLYTDGRTHPGPDELDYGFSGHSIAHWEGQVLVVDTVGISPRADLFMNSDVRVTQNTHVVERIQLTDAGTLQIDTVVADAELFTRPYVYSRSYERTPLPFTDSSCTQNNRDDDVDVDLTPPAQY